MDRVNNELFIGNVHNSSEEELKDMFSRFGEIESIQYNNKDSYAFVKFSKT